MHFWLFIPEKSKLCSHKNPYRNAHIAILFLIAENWEQPRCPSPGERSNKPRRLRTWSRVHNKRGGGGHSASQRALQGTVLSGKPISKVTYYTFHLQDFLEITMTETGQIGDCHSEGLGGVATKGQRGSFVVMH